MAHILYLYTLLTLISQTLSLSQTLTICSSGDCSWNNPSRDTIYVCTNTANSCTISMGSTTSGYHFSGGKLYSAAPTTTIDCNGDNGCRWGEFHCGNELPPNATYYGLTEANFSGRINNCKIDCNHIYAQVCADSTLYCSGDVQLCNAKSSIGESLDRFTMDCTGVTNPSASCHMECQCCIACDSSIMDCRNTLATCSATGNNKVNIQTADPTATPTTPFPTLSPTTGAPTSNTINPTLTPTINPTIGPTNKDEYSETYEISFETDNNLNEDEINTIILIAVESTYPDAEIISTTINDKSVVVTLTINSDVELDSQVVETTIKSELDKRDDIDDVEVKKYDDRIKKQENKKKSAGIVLGVIGSIVFILIICLGICIWYRWRISHGKDEKQIEIEMEYPMKINDTNEKHYTIETNEDMDDDIIQSVNTMGQTEGNETYSNGTNILQGEFVIDDDEQNEYATPKGQTIIQQNEDNDLDVDTIIDTDDTGDGTETLEDDSNIENETIVDASSINKMNTIQ